MIAELVTGRQLEAMAAENTALIVVFYSDWSRPCRLFEPVVQQAARQAPEGVAFARLNSEELPGLAQQYGIRSLPTLLYFKDGKAVRRSLGLQTPAGILEQLK